MVARVKKHWKVTESCEESHIRVDRDKGVIYNVLVLGRKARNGRRYTDEAMEEALQRKLYDRLQVYIGPHKRTKYAKRSPNNHAGELRNVYKAKDGLRAKEFHVNRESRGGRLAMEIAERFPNSFGLSHHADVAGYEEDGEKIITRILEVAVADIVKDAATTDGIFEEVHVANDNEIVEEEGLEEGEVAVETPADDTTGGDAGWKKAIKDLIAAIHDDDTVSDEDKMTATKAVMKVKKILGGGDEDDTDTEDDGDDTPSGEEEVDVKKLLKRVEALESVKKRPPQRPKSAPRSEVVEDVNPRPKDKTKEKPKFPKTRQEILDAYGDDDEE